MNIPTRTASAHCPAPARNLPRACWPSWAPIASSSILSDALRCFAGTAPVLKESGKMRFVHLRRACNKHLRHAVHLWADKSRPGCAWAEAYYQQKKLQGLTHAAALRCLGQRWLKILWKMWQTGSRYDEALHTRNQIKHGSWVIQLTSPPTA